MTAVLALGILMIIGCVYLLAQLVTLPARQRRASLDRATAYADGTMGLPTAPAEERRSRLTDSLGSLAEQLAPPTMLESMEQRIAEAGLQGRIAPGGVLAAKVIGCLLGLLLGAFIASQSGNALTGTLIALAFGAAFFVIPDRVIASKGRARKEHLAGDLPDALDLLAICVEAGMSLDGALGQLVEHMTGPLADEFAITLGEIRVGEGRQDALRRLAERCNIQSMTALVRSIIQSDQLGMPLGRVLRIQARDARIHRQQAAEERAAKMPVKMILPTAIFIFPVIFFVVIGPALIELFQVL